MRTNAVTPRRTLLAALLALAALLVACSDDAGGAAEPSAATPTGAVGGVQPAANLTNGCIDSYEDGVDYFPERAALGHATNFDVTYHDTYKVVTVHQPYRGGEPERYILLQCGAPAPSLSGDLAATQVVRCRSPRSSPGRAPRTPG